jgi:hypothetical protein
MAFAALESKTALGLGERGMRRSGEERSGGVEKSGGK